MSSAPSWRLEEALEEASRLATLLEAERERANGLASLLSVARGDLRDARDAITAHKATVAHLHQRLSERDKAARGRSPLLGATAFAEVLVELLRSGPVSAIVDGDEVHLLAYNDNGAELPRVVIQAGPA